MRRKNQHACSLLPCSAFSTRKKQQGCRSNKSRISAALGPLQSTPHFPSILLPLLLPADLKLRPQTGLLRGAGIRLGTQIMSKAPHLIPEQERGPAGYGCAVDRPPSSAAAINFPWNIQMRFESAGEEVISRLFTRR